MAEVLHGVPEVKQNKGKDTNMFPHQLAVSVKRLLYSKRGEPYRIAGRTLRYLPGTRPVRTRYAHSGSSNARYDALQALWLSTHLKEGDTALDIGAYSGAYTILMAAQC